MGVLSHDQTSFPAINVAEEKANKQVPTSPGNEAHANMMLYCNLFF